jgi:hypothetical protein
MIRVVTRSEDGILCFMNDKLQPIGEESKRLHAIGGTEVRALLNQATSGNTISAGVIVTTAGDKNVKSLVHTVLTNENDVDVRNKMLYSLHKANQHIKTLTSPFPGIKLFETNIRPSYR